MDQSVRTDVYDSLKKDTAHAMVASSSVNRADVKDCSSFNCISPPRSHVSFGLKRFHQRYMGTCSCLKRF